MSNKFKSFIALFISVVWFAGAQYQRMGIKKGTQLTILANSRGNVETYCMDSTLDAPTEGIFYKKILDGSTSVRVQFEGEVSKSLQEAIDAGEIMIEGTSWTVDYVMENLDNPSFTSQFKPEEIDEFKEFKELWDKLSGTAKDILTAEFGPLGDHTKMQLINKTNKVVSLSFEANALLGVDDSIKLHDLNSSLLDFSDQDELWYLTNVEYQKKLKTLGFYKGEINGSIDAETDKAIKDFQRQHGLDPTGSIDSETDQLLIEAFGLQMVKNKKLQEYFKANGGYNGKINGIPGKEFQQSISDFKANNGLSAFDIEVSFLKENVHTTFNNQKDFITYYKGLNEECQPELCLSDDMSISFSSSCLPGTVTVAVTEGLVLTIEEGTISYSISLFAAADESKKDDACRLSKSACFSNTIDKNYSLECGESQYPIKVAATQVLLSLDDLNVSVFE